LVGGACALASVDARRADMVALLAEACGAYAVQSVRSTNARGRPRILSRRPVVRDEGTILDGTKLSKLPTNTFGHAYAQFMQHYSLDANSRDLPLYCEGAEYAYVLQRYRETHDFVHVACGLPPSVVGELALKWFELVQTGFPMCALSSLGGSCVSRLTQRQMSSVLRLIPWAVRSARRAAFLPGMQWEKWMEVDLHTLRREMRIEAAPVPARQSSINIQWKGGRPSPLSAEPTAAKSNGVHHEQARHKTRGQQEGPTLLTAEQDGTPDDF